jgi:kynurenine formamidase
MTGDWGRWGPNDERGALNLVDGAAVLRGLSAARQQRVISLGLPLRPGAGPIAGMRAPMQHFMSRDGGDYAAGLAEKTGYGYSDDSIIVACHGTTHLDALSHVWRDGLMWNGYSASTVTSRGAAKCGIETAGPIVTRGLFLDLTSDPHRPLADSAAIGPDQLDRALAAAELEPQPGDALIVRTGWLARWRAGEATTETWPGLSADCGAWLGDAGISLVGADNIAVEVGPSGVPESAMPLHLATLRDRGIFLLELLDLEELAAASGSTELLLIVAPLNIVGGVGSPCAPVAVL